MTDTVNKQKLMQMVRDEIDSFPDVLSEYQRGAKAYNVALLEELESGRLDNPTPPTTSVQGYREALETLLNAVPDQVQDMYGYVMDEPTVALREAIKKAEQALSQTDIQPSGINSTEDQPGPSGDIISSVDFKPVSPEKQAILEKTFKIAFSEDSTEEEETE